MECRTELPTTELFSEGCKYARRYPTPTDSGYCIFHLPKEVKLKTIDEIGYDVKNEFNVAVEKLFRETAEDGISSWQYQPIDLRGFIFPTDFLLNKSIYNGNLVGCDLTGAFFMGNFAIKEMVFVQSLLFSNIKCEGEIDISKNNISRARNKFDMVDIYCENKFIFKDNDIRNLTLFYNLTIFGDFHYKSKGLGPTTFEKIEVKNNTIIFRDVYNDNFYFNQCKFGTPYDKTYYTSFEGVNYKGEVKFTNTCIYGNFNLNSTTFEHTLYFDNCEINFAPNLIGAKFEEGIDFKNTEFTNGNEITYRKIKKIMEEHKNIWGATVFFGKELEEKRKNSTVIENIKNLNYFYYAFNNYGVTWYRPLQWLFGITTLFAFIYYAFGEFVVFEQDNMRGWKSETVWYHKGALALLYSFQNIKLSWLFGSSFLVPKSICIWAISIIQSIFSVILIAMTAISIRKIFKI